MRRKKIKPDTALIATVYNEKDSIIPFARSISAQTVLPSRIVIVDGGSTDGTYKLLKGYFGSFSPDVRVDIIQERGAGISKGRNIAISRAEEKIICVSDGGCVLDRKWLETISGIAGRETVAGGYSACWARTFLQRCLAAAVLPLPREVKGESFMPSSRNICFYKKAWEDAGGYPENMDFGEDMKFNFALRECGYRISFSPRAVVYWKLRDSLRSVFRQFFCYAKGDAVGGMYRSRHMIRIASAAALAAVIVLSAAVSIFFLVLLLPLGLAYCFKAFRRIPAVFYKQDLFRKITAVLFIPFLLAYIDMAKLAGYVYGNLLRKGPAG
ncbi:MAG: glycosyltransferase [Actinomycetota bacterium]